MSNSRLDAPRTSGFELAHQPPGQDQTWPPVGSLMAPSGELGTLPFRYAIIMLDAEGFIEGWSDSARQITGYAEAEILNQPFSVLFCHDPGKRLELPNELHRASREANGSGCRGEYLLCRKDGSRFVGELVATALRDSWQRLSGFSCMIQDTGCRETAAQTINPADSACCAARHGDGRRFCLYDGTIDTHDNRKGLHYWQRRIEQALAEDGFQLYFQPVISLDAGRAARLQGEILLRLEDDDELLCANDFLAPAERNGQLIDIDRWVVRTTISSLNTMRPAADIGPILVSINIARQSLVDGGFQDFVFEQLARLTLPMARICFEFSEDTAAGDPAATVRFAERLHRHGGLLALDGSGSGLPSFNHLRHLPVDFLKIDGECIRELADDPMDMAIVETICAVGRRLGIRTIAGAVESTALLEKIKTIGLDYAQGFGIARPLPFEEALTELEAA